jgi:hypothetical protein
MGIFKYVMKSVTLGGKGTSGSYNITTGVATHAPKGSGKPMKIKAKQVRQKGSGK